MRLQLQQAQQQLPPDALSITGGSLASVSPVQGSGGK